MHSLGYSAHLISKAGAGAGTLHPAVTSKEGAASAETEAVLSVLTEKLGLRDAREG